MASNPADFVFVGNGCGLTAVSAVVGVAENVGGAVSVGRGVFWGVDGFGVERVVTFVVRVLVGWVGFVVCTFPRIRGF